MGHLVQVEHQVRLDQVEHLVQVEAQGRLDRVVRQQ